MADEAPFAGSPSTEDCVLANVNLYTFKRDVEDGLLGYCAEGWQAFEGTCTVDGHGKVVAWRQDGKLSNGLHAVRYEVAFGEPFRVQGGPLAVPLELTFHPTADLGRGAQAMLALTQSAVRTYHPEVRYA